MAQPVQEELGTEGETHTAEPQQSLHPAAPGQMHLCKLPVDSALFQLCAGAWRAEQRRPWWGTQLSAGVQGTDPTAQVCCQGTD